MNMNARHALVGWLILGGVAGAQDEAPASDDSIDPRAVSELKKMTAVLDRATAMVVKTRTIWEAVQDSGMKLQFEARQELGLFRPNKMYGLSTRDDGAVLRTWYDGKVLTHFDAEANTVARLDVPDTINAMLDHVLDTYSISPPPLLDFIYSDAEASFLDGMTAAVYAGEAHIAGKSCHHVAFSKADVDYQMWIPTKGDPLPVKYSITWTTDPHMPWFNVDFLEWTLKQKLSDASFTAHVPPDAKTIEVPPRNDEEVKP